jgi:NAD-dependent dihydropyrimidine dehydrogenase PreA subunit
VAVRIDIEVCEGSGVCEQVCPEDVFEHEDGVTRVVQSQACTECWICVEQCASAAIEID